VGSLNRLSRGFTGHEHLENHKHPNGAIGLIHMNGRVYDPELGVFLSADPFVQFSESTQGFNRYAYVGNNPLSYNDPRGYFVAELFAAGAAILKWAASSWYAAMITGATVGYLTSGSLEGALFGAVSGLVAYGVGVLPSNLDGFTDTLWRAAMHGLTQGGISAAQHGRFREGFLSAFTSKLLGPVEGGWSDFTGDPGGRVIQAAVIGGTVTASGQLASKKKGVPHETTGFDIAARRRACRGGVGGG